MFLYIFLTCLIIGIIHVYRTLAKRYHFCAIDKFPGPPSNLILGNLLEVPKKPEELFNDLRKFSFDYYPIYRIWGGYVPTVNILTPEDIEIILSNTKHHKKGWVYRCLQQWLGTGLLTSSGWKWHNRRKILTTAFHFNILQGFVEVFAHHSALLADSLDKECDKPSTVINPYITTFTLNTVCETAMGTRLDTCKKEQNDYVKAIHDMGKVVLYRIVRPWLFLEWLYKLTPIFKREKKLAKILHDFSMSVIENRKATFQYDEISLSENETYSKKKLAMLDLLIMAKNQGEYIDDIGIREEVDTFMFEGHDTTSTSLCFTLMLLACNQDVQNKVINELKTVANDKDVLGYMDLQNLKYLERVIKESLRLYPSVPFIARISGDKIVTHSGYTIPPNCNVNIHIYDLHHNPKIYPDPYKFDPDRFLPENNQKRHPFAYLPFSAGPRNCIGQKFAILQLKSAITSILYRYVLLPVDRPTTITLTTDLVLRAKDGIKIKIIKR